MAGLVRPQVRTDESMGASAAAASAASGLSPGKVAALLVGNVIDLLAMHIWSGEISDTARALDLCYSLYRGIDYALINNEVPSRARDLPKLLKQVYNVINDVSVKTAFMVLMISVKNACRSGWFPDKDVADLLTLAKEVALPFGKEEDICIESSNTLPDVSKIMSRYYPHIKMGKVLASFRVKPGYSAFCGDFHILKTMVAPGQDKIGLFVARTDNMDTSACLVTPPKVNFLLNGRGVLGRTVGDAMEKGPQLPTNVTPMVKYGVNLFQAAGEFSGNYIIIIAFLSVTSTPSTSALPDYIQPAIASVDSDLEITEGPSRVPLNCPISCTRIKNPVKGHLCKHYQCFDYQNFMKINSSLPKWRCPHCNQSVCYPDLRIDQNMVKILAEIGENVGYVMISADGSWKAVLENEDPSDKTHCAKQSCQQEGAEQCESVKFSSTQADIIDITEEGANENGSTSISAGASEKHSQDDHPSSVVDRNLVDSEFNNTSQADQTSSAQRENVIVSDPRSVNVSATSASGRHTTAASSEFLPIGSPVLTNAVSPVPNQGRTQLPLASLQNQISNTNVLQSQQFRIESSIANDNGRLPSISTSARIPFATSSLPALPAQAQDPTSSEQRISNTLMPCGSSASTYWSTPVVARNGGSVMGQQLPWSFVNSYAVSNMASSSTQHHLLTQSSAANDYRNVYNQLVQRVDGLTTQAPGTHPPGYPYRLHFNNPPLTPQAMWRQSQTMAHPSIHVQSAQTPQRYVGSQAQIPQRYGGSQVASAVTNRQPLPGATTAQSTAPMSRSPPSVPVLLQASGTDPALPRSMDPERLGTTGDPSTRHATTQPASQASRQSTSASASEQYWRPTKRMRGSLMGEAYSAVLNQFMIPPTPLSEASPSQLPPSGLVTGNTNSRTDQQNQFAEASQLPTRLSATLPSVHQTHEVMMSSNTSSRMDSEVQTYPRSSVDPSNLPGS